MLKRSSYQQEINWLFEQFPSYQKIGSKAYKPTLENIRSITERIHSPEKYLRFVHVAGSNGKGSTCSMLASILTEAGYKVGLFTSPHIKDFTERIRINGVVIPQEDVVEFIQKIKAESFDFSPSFFEVTFAMALNHFKKENCNICIIETGLGGRLDATNIITPILSVITNISLEHTNILGNTLEKIAEEKAGIIKENIPLALGMMSDELIQQFSKIASKQKAEVQLTIRKENAFDLPLLGEHQKDNFQLVLNALKIIKSLDYSVTDNEIQIGLNHLSQNTGFAGRLQIIEKKPLLIYDVSHNAEGIQATLKTIKELNQGQLHIIFGSSSDKDISSIIKVLPTNAQLYFTEFSNERSCTIDQLRGVSLESSFNKLSFYKSSQKALSNVKLVANQNDTILVIGSFFLVSELF
tara:strand:+ start:11249 stop:12478 length:1230 start_codon:yes stop_codon:yes gene_type:complete